MNFVANLHDDSFQVYENLEEYEAESLFRKLGLEPATDDHIEVSNNLEHSIEDISQIKTEFFTHLQAVLLASTDYEAFKCHVSVIVINTMVDVYLWDDAWKQVFEPVWE